MIWPVPEPTVAVSDPVVDDPDQPVPDTLQLKVVAPVDTAVYVAEVAPTQGPDAGGVTTGVVGSGVDVTVNT